MSCSKYNQASYAYKYPVDPKSLYAQNNYNNETGGRRYYEKKPFRIFEGFGFNVAFIIKAIIVVLLVMLLFNVLGKQDDKVYYDVNRY